MSLNSREKRTILALGALAFRYFDLVTAGNEAAAAEVRRAFIGLYAGGGRAALVQLNPAGASALPRSLNAARGWYTDFRAAAIGSIASATMSSTGASQEIAQALRTTPIPLGSLPAWWNGAGRPVIGARLGTSLLEALMEVEYAPQTVAGITAALNAYFADPTPVVDDWVDTGGDAPPSPGSSVAAQPTTPTVASVIASGGAPASPSPIALPGSVVKPRAGSGATWMYVLGGVVLAGGLGYGLWLARRRR
jgi:hypothetical protein